MFVTFRTIIKILLRNKFIGGSFIAVIIGLYCVIPLVSKLEYEGASWFLAKKTTAIEAALAQLNQSFLQHTKEVSTNKTLQTLLEQKNYPAIQAFLAEEKLKQPGRQLLITDANGTAVSRTFDPNARGENVFLTTAWGHEVAEGRIISAVEKHPLVQLALLSGVPIFRGGTLIGGAFVGQPLNDLFAQYIKNKYLPGSSQVIFYSDDSGLVGTSVAYTNSANRLKYYIGNGHKLSSDEAVHLVESNGDYFYIQNIALPSSDGSAGGMAVLIPLPQWYSTICISIFIGAVTYGLLLLVFKLFKSDDHKRYRQLFTLFGLGITACIVVIAFFSRWGYLYKMALHLKQPAPIYNSTLRMDPEAAVWDRSYEQRVAVRIDSGGESINTVRVVVQYDPAIAKVVEIDTKKSLCPPQMFLEREIDNKKGEVTITCVIPSPGFSDVGGVIAVLHVQPLAAGRFKLQFDKETAILANDGLGTDVLRQSISGDYQVTVPVIEQKSDGPPAPMVVFSPTHPNSERWYSDRSVQFTWLPQMNTAYSYWLDQVPSSTPYGNKQNYITLQDGIQLAVPADGVSYFHVTPQKNGIYGPTTNYKIKIDVTPPGESIIRMSNSSPRKNEVVRFEFDGSDATSGVQPNFYLKIDNSIWLPSLPEFSIPFLETGTHDVSVKVFDNAGNYTETTAVVKVHN